MPYAGEEGKWMVYLPNMKAGGLYDMKVCGDQSITFTDIMIGDDWQAAEQSNYIICINNFK